MGSSIVDFFDPIPNSNLQYRHNYSNFPLEYLCDLITFIANPCTNLFNHYLLNELASFEDWEVDSARRCSVIPNRNVLITAYLPQYQDLIRANSPYVRRDVILGSQSFSKLDMAAIIGIFNLNINWHSSTD